MSAYSTTLHDEDDNEIYPKTLAENVYDGNTRMDQKVDGIRTDLGSPSSASAVTGADAFSKISTLNSDLTADHTVGNAVVVSTYTSANPYVCPSDGIFQVKNNQEVGSIAMHVDSLAKTVYFWQASYESAELYCKKGNNIYVSDSTLTQSYVLFYPES